MTVAGRESNGRGAGGRVGVMGTSGREAVGVQVVAGRCYGVQAA